MLTPVNLHDALASFDQIYSPRIVARINDYDVRIAHTLGEHVWHVHTDTDEFFLALHGQFDIALRDTDGTERTVTLHPGDVFVVPKGTEHKPSSPGGAILMFEPNGTSTTGDRHDGGRPAVSRTSARTGQPRSRSARKPARQRPEPADGAYSAPTPPA
jgi:mannose-6-phosphate isomerase-like protein (cupin superfamily)